MLLLSPILIGGSMSESLQWGIFMASLDPVKGSEQAGRRPVLVISREQVNQLLPVVNVIPLTSHKANRKIYPNEVLLLAKETGLPRDSIALCYQVRTLDKSRLGNLIAQIENANLRTQIKDSLRFQLEV
jgi:mRNA interferase MazF